MIDVTKVPSLLCGVVWEIRSREFIISGFSLSELNCIVHSICSALKCLFLYLPLLLCWCFHNNNNNWVKGPDAHKTDPYSKQIFSSKKYLLDTNWEKMEQLAM